jgi:APA family basic amino acid/polyamine antiporter
MAELRRDLGLWGAVSIVIGTVIGSGIFLVPRTMVRNVGTPGLVFSVWIVGGLLSLAGALTYAELAAAMPEAGGEYVYLSEAYGPIWGYLYGWTQMWVAKSGSIATLATGFFLYLANFWPGLETVIFHANLPFGYPFEIRYGQFLAIALIMGLAWLNYFGVKVGGGVQVVITALKVGLIGLVVVAGIAYGPRGGAAVTAPIVPLTLTGFIAALVAALWAYDGWNNVSMVSSEIKNPKRFLPLALIGGTLAVMAIYLSANFVYFHVLSAIEVDNSDRVAAVMMRKLFGGWGANAVSAAAMISIFAALNGSILSGARVPYAMARDGRFFPAMAAVNPKYHTPGVAILGLSAWGSVLVLSGKYDDLADFVIFGSWILYAMTTASVVVLRRTRPNMNRPYRTWGYPFVPIVFVLAALLIEMVTLINKPWQSCLGIVLIVSGIPFYGRWKRTTQAARLPLNE